MMVLAEANCAGADQLNGVCDSGSSPTQTVWTQYNYQAGRGFIIMMVPNNCYYKITSSAAPSIISWIEYQLNVPVAVTNYTGTLLRSLGVAQSYKNGSGKDMWISVGLSSTGGSGICRIQSDAIPPIWAQGVYSNTNNPSNRMAWGLAQFTDYYNCYNDTGTPVVQTWMEYVLN